jgi:hypothetical protein
MPDAHDHNCSCCRLSAEHPSDLSREEYERLWREFIAEGKQGGGP